MHFKWSLNCLFCQTTLSSFQKPDFSVPRQHEDFIWLHDTLVETEDYAGLIVSDLLSPPHTRTLVWDYAGLIE